MLGIVTCFYNPCGYQRILRNYHRFRAALNRDIVTVELSFNGKFEIPDAIHLTGNASHLMWQKERLLNIGLECLPEKYNHVAWIDTDMLFLNQNWEEEAESLLETHRVVQLCERIHQTDSAGRVASSKETFAKGFLEQRLKEQWFHTGGAWAARRDLCGNSRARFQVFDRDIIGGADSFMAFAWIGETQRALLHAKHSYSNHVLEYYQATAEVLHQQVQGQIGYVPGDAVHLWHGDIQNRLYIERRQFLKKYNFNPLEDIAIDKNGLWAWNSNKPGMHRDVANYFHLRQEDGPAETPENPRHRNSHSAPKSSTTVTSPRQLTRWSVGIITQPQEKSLLQRSLQSLSNAGFEHPHLFASPQTEASDKLLSTPIRQKKERLQTAPLWYLALTEMVQRTPTAEAYLLCPGNTLFPFGLRDHLEKTLWPARKIGSLSLYSAHQPQPGESAGYLSNGQTGKNPQVFACVFPNRSAHQFVADFQRLHLRQSGSIPEFQEINATIRDWCQQTKLPYYIHTPSLVQFLN